jgi:PncC family amidohydrolase
MVSESQLEESLRQTCVAVAKILVSQGKYLAVAESCTGGYLSKVLTDESGSSAYFRGGCVPYSNEAKTAILKIDPGLIQSKGAVSEEVAQALACGVSRELEADFGIGVSGVAGPMGGTRDKPVGTVWISVCAKEGESNNKLFRFSGPRHVVRGKAVFSSLLMLQQFICRQKELDIVLDW